MSSMRVMQLGSPTGLYGAERWILALVRHLDVAHVESIVSVIRDDPSYPAALCEHARSFGFRTEVFEAYGKVNWSAVRQLRQYVEKNGVHILHTHGYKTDTIGLMATRGTSCRLVSTPHGWSVRAGVKLRIYEAIDRAIFPFFDAVAPLSDGIFDELKGRIGLGSKLELIRNGVDISEIDAVKHVSPEIETWRADGSFIVGYVGQLIARKGLTTLLKAFSKLPAARKKLVIIGEGEQKNELVQLASTLNIGKDVAFLGFRNDRLAFLKGFDVSVLPSQLEGIPRTLMEAMAASIPVVASNIPGCTDLISHDETGLLFELDNVDALAGCLTTCMDQGIRARLGKNGRQFILENFSAARMADQYHGLYQKLLAN
jgi:glycosyltransferase involved in cell wall biosynthesis